MRTIVPPHPAAIDATLSVLGGDYRDLSKNRNSPQKTQS
jgi:hypothetical protein